MIVFNLYVEGAKRNAKLYWLEESLMFIKKKNKLSFILFHPQEEIFPQRKRKNKNFRLF